MNLAEYAIKRKTITIALTVSIVIAGIISYFNLPRLEDPEFTIKDALIITRYPGASPTEVEQQVTDLLETEIQKLSQVDQVTSISKAGQSIITVSMLEKYGKDTLPDIWTILRAKIRDISVNLPPGAQQPQVVDDFGDVYGFVYALTGDGFSHKEMYEYAKYLRKELLLVDGVGKVDLWGVQEEAIYIDVSQSFLSSINRNLLDLSQLFSSHNSIAPAGHIKVGPDYIRVQSNSALSAVKDIENLFILNENGSSIYLKDVAKVTRDYVKPSNRIMSYNGAPAIGLSISNSSGENVVEIGRLIQEKMMELHNDIPLGLEAHPVILQDEAVNKAIDGFLSSLIQAVIIVFVVLLLFMGFRTGLIIGFVLVVTVVITFNTMLFMGIALERISLGALIIALGMLVDNAIVICEGMQVRIKQGKDRLESAILVVSQNQWPLFGATAIAILAFSSIGLSQNATGEYCRSLFVVILFSLIISWILALTLTPLLCYWFLPGNESSSEGRDKNPYDGLFFRKYRESLVFCLHHRWPTVGVTFALLILAGYGFGFVQQSFFPKSTMPYFMVHYWLPEGSDIRTTASDVKKIENHLTSLDGVESVTSFVGEGAPRFVLVYSPEKTNSSYAYMLVKMDNYKKIDGMVDSMSSYLRATFPRAEPKVQKFNSGPAPKSSIEVRFSGRNEKVLRQLSVQAQDIMRNANAEAVRDNWRQQVKVIDPMYSEQRGSFSGVPRSDLNSALEMNYTGKPVGVYREGNELLSIYARLDSSGERSVSDIGNIQVWSSSGQTYIPIMQVVETFKTRWTDSQIQRRDRKRTITVGAEPKNGVLPSFIMSKIQHDIDAIELPPGYERTWGGELESSSEAQSSLFVGIIVSLAVMMLISVLLFNSLRQPAIIWSVVPFSVIGVSIGLLVTGLPFGFMALLGFLSLSGMLIKNVIVLLEQIVIEQKEGKDDYSAVIDSAISRSRPVLMAAGTTVLGMIPLAGDAFFAAMAVTIMSGLAFASILTLIIVPVIYTLVYSVDTRIDAGLTQNTI